MDNINWLEEVTQRQDELLERLFRQLKIASVREDDQATEDAPVGPGPKAALEEFLAMAEEDGFETKQFGPWAGRVEIGQGEELFGILGHVDVVPVGTGWNTDPFEPQIIDGKIYGRGSSDDKGPTVGAYFAIKMLKDMGVEFNKRIHLIIGTDEESGWQCMDHYFQEAEMPDFGFSPDGNFPIINGEKGNVSAIISGRQGESVEGGLHLISLKAGLRPNMVPQDVTVKLVVEDSSSFLTDYNQFLANNPELQGQGQENHGVIELSLIGKAAHGSTPHAGKNAATHIAQFLIGYKFDQEDAQNLISLLAEELFEGFDGSKVGAAYHHEVMGDVSMNLGIVNYSDQHGIEMDINFRYPQGTHPDTIQAGLEESIGHYHLDIEMGDYKEPHYVPADDPLVKTLLEVYENQTGEPGYEKSIGGGTYGRLMPRGVAYGALFPDSTDTMHQANEFFSVEDLLKSTAIYAEAIYRLSR